MRMPVVSSSVHPSGRAVTRSCESCAYTTHSSPRALSRASYEDPITQRDTASACSPHNIDSKRAGMFQSLTRPLLMALTGGQGRPGSLSVDWVDPTTAEVTNSGSAVRARPREDSSLVCFTPTEPISDARSVVIECSRDLRLEGQTPENLEGEALPVTLLFKQNTNEVVVASALSELEVVVESADTPGISRVIAFERDSLIGLERLTICRGRWFIRYQDYVPSSETVDLELICRLTDSESAAVSFDNGCRVRISRLEANAGHIDLGNTCFIAGIEIIQPLLSLGISQEITDASIECRVLELQSRPSNSRIVVHEKLTLAHGAESCDIQANGDAVPRRRR